MRISKTLAAEVMAKVVYADPAAWQALRALNIHVDATKDIPGRFKPITWSAYTYEVTIGSARPIALSDTTIAAARRLVARMPSAHRKQLALKVAGAQGSASVAAALGLGLPTSGEKAHAALCAIGETVLAEHVLDTSRGLKTNRATMRNKDGEALLRDAVALERGIAELRLTGPGTASATLDRSGWKDVADRWNAGRALVAIRIGPHRSPKVEPRASAWLEDVAAEIALRCDGKISPEREMSPKEDDDVTLSTYLLPLEDERTVERDRDEATERLRYFLTGIGRADLLR